MRALCLACAALRCPQVRGSRFVRYQECKIQESPDEVPQGSTPRTLMVQLRGALTRSVKAGDSVSVAGIFLPEPYSGPQVRACAWATGGLPGRWAWPGSRGAGMKGGLARVGTDGVERQQGTST